MEFLEIYRNNVLKFSETFKEDYESFQQKTGHYVVNGFLVILLNKENALSKKIMKVENFTLNKEEKKLPCEILEKHIAPQVKEFRNAKEDDIFNKVVYKNQIYLANVKNPEFRNEKNILRAMSLYNTFYDPYNKDIIEIRFNEKS